MTTKEAAKELGVTPTTLLNYVKSGDFPKPETVWRGKQKSYEWSVELVAKYKAQIEAARNS